MGASLSFWTRRRRGPRRGSKVLHWPGDASGGWVLAHIHSQPAGCDSALPGAHLDALRSEEHTSELQSLMRISYAVFCLKKKKHTTTKRNKATQRKRYR